MTGTDVASLAAAGARRQSVRLRPFVLVALTYVGGVILGAYWQPPLAWLFGACAVVGASALAKSGIREPCLWSLLFLAGWTHLVCSTAVLSPLDLRRVLGGQVTLATVRGRLVATPMDRVISREQDDIWRSVAIVEAEAVQRDGSWEPVIGQVNVATAATLPRAFYGGRMVEVSGVIGHPKGPAAEGLFDYRNYLRWQGIHYQLRADTAQDWRLVPTGRSPPRLPVADRFCGWAQATLRSGLPVEDQSLWLLWAMTLGWKTGLTDEVSEPFMRTGTMHIFAISGLHVALIAGMLVALLRVVRVPRAVCGVVVIPLIWFYTAVTGWQASAIRSTIMMTIIVAGWALNRPGDLLNSLAGAGFIILLWDPRQLFQASFQLSFFVVLGIALLLSPVQRGLDRLLAADPLLPPDLVPRWRRWLEACVRPVCGSLATSLAAWLGSLPLIAYYFHLVTPVSLLVNLVVIPLAGLALMANLGSLVCGDWLPATTELFNHAAWLFMWLMARVCDWTVKWPGACFNVRPPGLPIFILYYGVLLGCLTGWLLARQRRVAAGVAGAVVLLVWGGWSLIRPASAQITVLALPGGAAEFVEAANPRQNLLVDCGDPTSVRWVVKPFLQARGVNRLPKLVLTHGDLRHVGGTDVVRDAFAVGQVCTSSVRSRSPSYRRILEGLSRQPGRWLRVRRGEAIAGWQVLHPDADRSWPQADDNAIVLRGEFQGTRVLLLSDLGRDGQRSLLAHDQDLAADIVISSVPFRGEPLGEPLLNAIRPRAVIINDALLPAAERAGPQIRQRLARRNIPVVYTSEQGTATVRLDSRGWEIRTMKGPSVNSRRPRVPLASLTSDSAPERPAPATEEADQEE